MIRAVRRAAVLTAVVVSTGLVGPAASAAEPASEVVAAGLHRASGVQPTPEGDPTRPGPLTSQDVATLALPPYEQWLAEVRTVTDEASAYLDARLPDTSRRTAIVLDIDNTALQTTYRPGLTSPATPGVLDLARQAQAEGAAVFFVTSRPEILRGQTIGNLSREGYPRTGLLMRGWIDFRSDEARKTAHRRAIERMGYTIVANVGNNDHDLRGGSAERTFKLPDYDGQLS